MKHRYKAFNRAIVLLLIAVMTTNSTLAQGSKAKSVFSQSTPIDTYNDSEKSEVSPTPTPTKAADEPEGPEVSPAPTPTKAADEPKGPEVSPAPTPTKAADEPEGPEVSPVPTPTKAADEPEGPEVSPSPTPTEAADESEEPEVGPSPAPIEDEENNEDIDENPEEELEKEELEEKIFEDWILTEDTVLNDDMEVGNLIVKAKLSLNGYQLIVHGDVTIERGDNSVAICRIVIDRGSLICKGSFELINTDKSYLEMKYPEDYLMIEEDFNVIGAVGCYVFSLEYYFFEYSYHKEIVNTLTDGTIELMGNVLIDKSSLFMTVGSHRIILSGTEKQEVDAKGLLCHFANLEIQNYSAEGIVSNIELSTDNLITNGCNVSTTSEYLGWTLFEDQVIEGALYLNGGELNLNGHKLTINGNFIHSNGVLSVNGGSLYVNGNYCMATFEAEDERIICTEGSGRLVMVNPEDYIYIRGSFIMDSNQWNKELLTEGTIEIRYHIARGADKVETMFESSNNHLIYLTNDYNNIGLNNRVNYTISDTLPYVYSFSNILCNGYIKISNKTRVTNGIGGIIDGDIYVEDELHLLSDLAIYSPNTIYGNNTFLDVNGYTIRIYGKFFGLGDIDINGGSLYSYGDKLILEQDIDVNHGLVEIFNSYPEIRGNINVNGGTLLIAQNTHITGSGNININKGTFQCYSSLIMKYPSQGRNYLTMVNSEDRVIIGGNYIAEDGLVDPLTEGVIEIKGSFTQKDGDGSANKFSEGNHKVILNGDYLQIINIEAGWFEFAYLELQNHTDGVYSQRPVPVKNLVDNGIAINIDPYISTGFTLTEDMIWEGDLHLYSGEINLNGYNLTVTGDFCWINSTLRFDGSSNIIIYGDFIVPTDFKQNNYGTSIINSGNSKQCIIVLGNMEIRKPSNSFYYWSNIPINLKGDFKLVDTDATKKYYFHPNLILSGDKEQRVITNCTELSMNHLTITNTSDEGVILENDILVRQSAKCISGRISGPGRVRLSSLSVINDYWNGDISGVESNSELTNNIKLDGALTSSYNIDLKGYTLEVEDFHLTGGEVRPSKGSIICNGSFTLEYNARIYMDNPEDNIVVREDFLYKSYGNSNITNGTLVIQGDFHQFGSEYSIGNKFSIILDGKSKDIERKQNVYIEIPNYFKLQNITITRGLNAGYTFSTKQNKAIDVHDICTNLIRDYMDETPPSKVEGLVAEKVTEYKINLSWEPSSDENGINGYHIYQNDIKIADINDISYRNILLDDESIYTYYIVAYDDMGNLSEPSDILTVTTITDTEAPTIPTNTRIKYKTGSSVIIAWDKSTDTIAVTGYEIYRGDDIIAKVTSGTEYKDTTAKEGVVYEYRIKAYDAAGNISDFSNSAKGFAVMPEIVRIEPKDYSRIGGDNIALRLVFANSGNSIGNQVKYEYRTLNTEYTAFLDTLLEQKNHSTNTLCTDFIWNTEEFTSGVYDIRVTLYDEDGNEAVIEVQYTLDKTPPQAPRELSAVSKNSTVDISWQPSVSEDCTYYTIYRLKETDNEYVKIGTIKGRLETYFQDKDVIEGELIRYRVTASDEFNQESVGAETLPIEVESDKEPPRIQSISPTNTRISGSIAIKVEATDNYGVETIGLEYREENSQDWIELDSAAAKNNIAEFNWDTSYLNGIYILRVTAIDYSGNTNSDEYIKRYDIDNTGISKIIITSVVPNITSVSLQWEDATENDFAYFQVEQRKGDKFEAIKKISNTLGMHITGLRDSTEYIFRVVAYDDLGNRGTPSDEVIVTTLEDTVAPIITRLLPLPTYYSGNLKLQATVSDNVGAIETEFFYSTDKQAWKSLSVVQATSIRQSNTFTYLFNTSDLNEGEVYIKVTTRDAAGNNTTLGDGNQVISYIIDRTAPSEVKNLIAEGKNGYVSLTWDTGVEKDIAGYRIYRTDLSGEFHILNYQTPTLNYYDTTTTYGKTYQYKVAAIDIAGNRGKTSNIAEASVLKDTEAPVIHGIGPEKSSVVGPNPTITVLVSDNVSLKTVDISYQKEGSEDYLPIEILTQKNMNGIIEVVWDTKNLDDGNYYLEAIACDLEGNESKIYKTSYTLDKTPPKTPVLELYKDNWRIDLSWNASEDNDISEYHVLRKSIYEDKYTIIGKLKEKSYTDNRVIPLANYIYKVRAYDSCGNYSDSYELIGHAYDKDTIAPVAYASDNMVGIAGLELAFDGSGSTDNVRVTEFIWDMGNGDVMKGAQPVYTYKEAGEYQVNLTVKDKEGNMDSVKINVIIYDQTRAGTVKIKVVDASGASLPGTAIYVNYSEDTKRNFSTNTNGELSISANTGVYKIAAYKQGYLPNDTELRINPYDELSITIKLEKKELVTGNLTSRRLSLQEMVDAGIDLSDPSNYHTFSFSVDLTFAQSPLPVRYEYIVNWNTCTLKSVSGGGGGGGSHGYGGSSIQFKPIGGNPESGEPILAYVHTNQSISWMKEMFEVSLGILNNASTEYVITDSVATLDIPNGLSLVSTEGGQSLRQYMGDIVGQQQKSVSWFLKGDESGDYNVNASFDGILMPFEEKIHASFVTSAPISVSTGEGLHIYISPEEAGYIGEDYYIQFRVTNESLKPFYKLTTDFGPYTSPGYIEEHTIIDEKTGEVTLDPYEGETYSIPEANFTGSLPVIRNGDIIEVGALLPGESIYGTYHTIFEGEGNPEEVYYKLVESLVTVLSGENTGVQVHVEPIASHINRYTTKIITIENLWADPVDMTSGAFLSEHEVLSVNGLTPISLDINYNSLMTEKVGDLGIGWTHNFENHIVDQGGTIKLYWSPSSYSTFVRTDAVNKTVYGYKVDDKIILSKESQQLAQEYTCISADMKGIKLYRNEDGTYKLILTSHYIYHFDREGQLTQMIDPSGRSIYLYHSNDKLEIVEKVTGKQLTVNFDNGLISSVEDQTGRISKFYYSNNCLTKITNPLGESVYYSYDDRGRILTAKNNDGLVFVTNTYDEKGRVLTQDDGSESTPLTYFGYDDTSEYGRTITNIIDRNGEKLQIVSNRQGDIIGTTNPKGETIVYTYDSSGNKASSRDGENNVIQYYYDNNKNLIKTVDAYGVVTSMTYDSRGNVLTISSNGSTVTNTYNDKDLLTSTKAANEKITKYTYNDNRQVLTEAVDGLGTINYQYEDCMLTSISDYRGNKTKLSYDEKGNIISVTDREGATTRFTFDKLNRRISEENALGEVTKYEYNSSGLQSKVIYPTGDESILTYDNNNYLKQAQYADGEIIKYVNDSEGRQIKRINPDSSYRIMSYDAAGNLSKEINENGEEISYTYNSNADILSVTEANGAVTSYEYYPNGKLYKLTYDDGSRIIYSYDKQWRLIRKTNHLGNSLSYEYDKAGNLTCQRDPLGNEYHYEYDIYGNQLKKIDPNGNVTQYSYDSNGNCVKVTDALGGITEYVYDNEDRVTSIIRHSSSGNELISYEYDVLGRVKSVTDGEGNQGYLNYDISGNVSSVVDAMGITISETIYDKMGNPIEIRDGIGNITSNSYDSLGNLIKIISNPNTNVEAITKYSYDNIGQLIMVEDAENGLSKYEYDSVGNIISLIDPNGGITKYEYDSLGRLLHETNAIGSKSGYTYNAIGLLEESINARNQSTSYKYDAAGRITSITDELGTTSYTYDANSNILTVSDDKGSISRKYDALNRVTEYTDYKGNTVKYSYDELGNLISLTYPGGEIVRYSYNKNGQLTRVKDWQDRITTYEYDRNGRLVKLSRPDGSIEAYEYDRAGQLITQENKNGDVIINRYSYTYDEAGNITKKTSTTEENAQELSSAVMLYDKANRLISYNGIEVLYDSDGNMIYGPLDGEMTAFEYDCRNRLIKAGNLSYEYDAENNRIAIVDSRAKTRTEFILNTNTSLSQILSESQYRLDENGSIVDTSTITKYIYGLGLIAQENQAEGYLTYHYDNLGSTTAITNIEGEVIYTYTYGPYGELLSGDKDRVRFLYNGMYGVMTDSNGLYYMRARYYNVDIKRFINQDVLTGTIANSQSLNRYSYVQGNPISLTDPFGLSPDISWRGIGHGILDLLGFIPVVGDVFDVVNAVWYASEGNYLESMSCMVSALPGIGSFVGNGIKWGTKGAKTATKIADGILLTTKIASNTATLARGSYGVVVTGKKIYTDIKDGKGVSFGDAVKLGLNVLTVGISGKRLKNDISAGISSMRQAKQVGVADSGAPKGDTNTFGICFTGDTLVKTEDGPKQISDIKVGDKVYAENEDTGEKGYKNVKQIFINDAYILLHISVKDTVIKTTFPHPFYVVGKGWVEAKDLKVGDILKLANGETTEVEALEIEELETPVKVYNFEVEDWHTYYVSEYDVLVHNTGSNPCAQGGLNTNETPINTGTSMPRDKATPNSIYEQINPDGTVKSRAFYDQKGNQFNRQDYDHLHFDKKTKQSYQPHEHNYKYNDKGQPAGKSDGPLTPGYNNKPTR